MFGIYSLLIIINVIISFILVCLIVFQKTSGDGLLTSSNKSNFMSGDEVAGFLTKLTGFFVFAFMVNTIAIASVGSRISKSANLIKTQQEQTKQEQGQQQNQSQIPS